MAIGNNIKIINSFSMATSKPLDDREVVSTITDMLAIPTYLRWIGMQVYVTENNTRFKWDGTSWLVEHLGFCKGSGAPSTDNYSAGDMYIDTDNGNLYYKTLSTANTLNWELQTNITGPKGDQGEQGIRGVHGSYWYTGTGITGESTTPTLFPSSGVDQAEFNDCYINTDTGNLYQCTVAGNSGTAQWVYTGTLEGPAGPQGEQGERGEQGEVGPEGQQGTRGSNIFSGDDLLGPTASGGQVFPNATTLANTDVLVNDAYLNGTYGHIYTATAEGKGNAIPWRRFGVLKNGSLYISDAPNATDDNDYTYPLSGVEYANVGDWIINPVTGIIYKCTAEGDPNTATWKYTSYLIAATAVGDIHNNPIEKYVYGVTANGNKTIRITLGDSTYTDVPIQIDNYQGATTSAAGVAGLVPAAGSGETSKFLRSDGSWATVTSAQGYLKLDGSTPMEGDLDVSNHTITNVADPTNDNHAATKGYVDNAVSNVSISCDTALDASSTNPVTNAAITARINELATQITNLTTTVNGKLASNAKITLTGDVSGTGTFSNNAVSITTTVADDSHNHTIANIDNLQSQLNTISSNANSAKTVTDKYATMLNIIGNNQ